MDCHLPNTEFELLGFFKEPNYDEWMEQLFKHLGICIWTDAEYEFMQDDRELWPTYCTAVGDEDGDGDGLYYHVKPLSGGSMTIGIYSDAACIEEYNDSKDALTILGDAYGYADADDEGQDNGDEDYTVADLEEYIDKWNSAFDIFKIFGLRPWLERGLAKWGRPRGRWPRR